MKLLIYLLLPAFVVYSEDVSDVLLCRQCGHEISEVSDLRNIHTPFALNARNETIGGISNVLVQLVENPDGDYYEILTTANADTIVFGDWMEENTWFPNYLWKVGICPHCGAQLGWVFDKGEGETQDENPLFMALITYRVISRNCNKPETKFDGV